MLSTQSAENVQKMLITVGRVPVMMASGSFSFQCFATLSARGSSGLGALSSAWMLQHRMQISVSLAVHGTVRSGQAYIVNGQSC